MIHTKELQFNHNGIDFKATVTYSDKAFSAITHADETAFYHVQLHTPIEMDCGGAVKTINGMMSYMLFQKMKEWHYVYNEKDEALNEGDTNVYTEAIRKILYSYYNREVIAKYKKQVKDFENAVDLKFASVLEALKEKKHLLKKRLRSSEIDSKAYQKRLKPIRLEKEETEHKVWYLKHQYEKRYFECCELKQYYRIVKADKVTFCDDRYSTCGWKSYYAKTKKEQ